MPPKVYLAVPPAGDFRAMPAKGGGLAILKWVTSFPGNPARGLPVVMGMICVSSAETGEPLALIDVRAVTALRTGAVAAVAAQELAREDARSRRGSSAAGLHGAWAARCLAAAEFGPGVCFDVDPEAAGALAGELGWEAGAREDALACDIVTCVTPGHEPVVRASDLRPGRAPQHARRRRPGQGRGRARRDRPLPALLRRVGAGEPRRRADRRRRGRPRHARGRDRARRGADRRGRRAARRRDEITLFDSTGLAIQDLALCHAVLEAAREGRRRVRLSKRV